MKIWKLVTIIAIVFIATVAFPIGSMGFWDVGGLTVSYATPDFRIRNLSLEVRNVPIHPDDSLGGLRSANPIERTNYSTAGSVTLGPWLARNIGARSKVGFHLHWLIYPGMMSASIQKSNYTHDVDADARGYAAYTVVAITKKGPIPTTGVGILDQFLKIMPELFVEFKLLGGEKSLRLGASASYFQLIADTGWDRFNHFETHEEYTLAHVIPATMYLAYQFGEESDLRWLIAAGAQFPVVFKTPIGERSALETSPSYFIRMIYEVGKQK